MIRRWDGVGGGEEADTPGGGLRFSPSPPPDPRLENSEGLSVLLGFLPEAEWALPGDKAGASFFSLSFSLLFFKALRESRRGLDRADTAQWSKRVGSCVWLPLLRKG